MNDETTVCIESHKSLAISNNKKIKLGKFSYNPFSDVYIKNATIEYNENYIAIHGFKKSFDLYHSFYQLENIEDMQKKYDIKDSDFETKKPWYLFGKTIKSLPYGEYMKLDCVEKLIILKDYMIEYN